MTSTDQQTPPRRRLGRTRKWIKRIAVLLVVCLVLGRVSLALWLPSAVDSAIASTGLRCEWEGFALSLLGGDVELRHADIYDTRVESTTPLAHIEYARLDVDVASLFLFDLRIHRVEIDGFDAHRERDASGRWLLPEAEPAENAEPGPEPEPVEEVAATEPAPPPQPWDLSWPLQLDALRVQHARIQLVDRTADIDWTVELQLRVSDLGHPTRRSRGSLHVTGPQLLDAITADLVADSTSNKLEIDLDIDALGIRTAPIAPMLTELGARPIADSLDASCLLEFELRAPENTTDLVADLALRELTFSADDATQLGVEAVESTVTVRPEQLVVDRVRVSGVRANAARSAQGAIRVGGCELVPVAGIAPSEQPPAAPDDGSDGDGKPLDWAVQEVEVGPIEFSFHDAALARPAVFRARLDSLVARDLGPGRPARVQLIGSLGDAIPRWTATASVEPQGPGGGDFAFNAEFAADRLDFVALDPWLRPAGLAGDESNARVRASVSGNVATEPDSDALELRLANAALQLTGETVAVGLESASAEVALRSDGVHVRDAAFNGLHANVTSESDGSLLFAGVRTTTAAKATTAPSPDQTPAATPTPTPMVAETPTRSQPKGPSSIRIDRLELEESWFDWTDSTGSEPRTMRFDFGAALREFSLGGAVPTTAKAEVKLHCDDIGSLQLDSTIESRPGALDLDASVTVHGEGINLQPLSVVLQGTGIEPTLRNGRFGTRIAASVQDGPDAMRANLELSELSLRDADRELIALDSLKVEEIAIGSGTTRIARIAAAGARASARRDAEGTIHAAGFAIAPQPDQQVADTPPPTTTGSDATSKAAPAQQSAFELGGLTLGPLTLQWQDESAPRPLDTSFTVHAKTGRLALGSAVPLELEAKIDNAIDRFRIDGTVTLDLDAPRAAFAVRADGLRGGGLLDAYLAPGTSFAMRDGKLRVDLDAKLDQNREGGLAIDVAAREFELRDGTETPSVGIAEIALRAPRVDPERGAITVDEIALRRLRCVARRDGDVWVAAGLRIDPTVPAPAGDPAAAEPATTPPPIDPNAMVSAALPPRIDVRQFALEIASLEVHDGAAPPLIAQLGIRNLNPIAIIGPEPESLPPWQLELTGNAGAALEHFRVGLDLSPWQLDPTIAATFEMRGLNGSPIHESLPSLEGVDLRELVGGHAAATLAARLELRRRDPAEFDLSRGFGVELELSDVALHATADGPRMIGVDSVFVEAPRIAGTGGAVHVRELAIDGITAGIHRDADGIRIAGVRFTPSAQQTEPQPATEPTPKPSPAGSADSSANTPTALTRVDRIDVNGLDFVLRDETFDPPFVLPLDELAASVSGFRIGGDAPPPPTRFELMLGAGKAELPRRTKASSALVGLLSSAGEALTGGSDTVQMEQRPILGEIVVKGEFVPAEKPRGVVDVGVAGLELVALRGPAKQGGIDIGDGLFDARVKVALDESGSSQTNASFTFADLILDEPPGGPISTYLKLPAPLQSVLFVLKDDNDEITVPLDIKLAEDGGVGGTQIAGAAATAVGTIATDAIASSPFRVAGSVTGLLGFGGEDDLPEDANVLLEYRAGEVTPPADALAQMETLLDLLDDSKIRVVLQPLLGFDDLQRAEVLATPPEADRRSLVTQLRQRKRALWRQRGELSTDLDAAIRLRDQESVARVTDALRRVDAEIGTTETALDRCLALLRPGADRRNDRRARRLALEFAAARTEQLRQLLIATEIAGIADRIEVRRPRLPDSDEMQHGVVSLTPRRSVE